MNLKEAKELLERLRIFENSPITERGFIALKFFIIPSDLKHEELNPFEIWHENYDFQKNPKNDIDYSVIGYYRKSYSVFLRLNDLKTFID